MDREQTAAHGHDDAAWMAAHPPTPARPDAIEPRPGRAAAAPTHPMRARIHGYVTRNPGVHMGDLVRDLRLGWGNAHHHLDRMERKGQLVREREANRVRLFVPGQMPAALRHAYAVLKNECLRDTFRAVVERPGIIQRDVAVVLGVTPTAARKHLRRLADEGLVHAERAGNHVRYRAAADAVALEMRLRVRAGDLGEASPKRAHPNDPAAERAPPMPFEAATPHDHGLARQSDHTAPAGATEDEDDARQRDDERPRRARHPER